MNRIIVGIAFTALASGRLMASATAADAPPATAPTTQPKLDKGALEKKFAELLTDATLTGEFNGGDPTKPAHTDSYKIKKAVKLDGDNWAITAVMEFKGFPIPVTMTVPVLWAGDTPIISVTEMKFPPLGTYTARVMLYHDEYVGVWMGTGHGGQMWGKVEHGVPTAQPTTKPASR